MDFINSCIAVKSASLCLSYLGLDSEKIKTIYIPGNDRRIYLSEIGTI